MKFKNTINQKWVKWVAIPLALFVFWLISAIIINSPAPSPSIITSYHSSEVIEEFSTDSLLESKKIIGEIRAREDNFGIIAVRIDLGPSVDFEDEDEIIFRVKEKGADEWIAENTYRSGLMYESKMFPFGFPKISDSRGNNYIFEIESVRGNRENAISLSNEEPLISSQYEFELNQVLSSPDNFINFGIKRTVLFTTDINFVLFSIPFLMPLVIYLSKLYFIKNDNDERQRRDGYPLLSITGGLLFVDLFVNPTNINTLVIIVPLLVWVYVLYKTKYDSTLTFLLVAVLFVAAVFAVVIQYDSLIMKASSWAYLFLLLGAIQTVFELRKNNTRYTYRHYLQKTFKMKL